MLSQYNKLSNYLPKYPDQNKSNFLTEINKKFELLELGNTVEVVKGIRNYQEATRRYIFNSKYNRILVFWDVGFGKTRLATLIIIDYLYHIKKVYIGKKTNINANLNPLVLVSSDDLKESFAFDIIKSKIFETDPRTKNEFSFQQLVSEIPKPAINPINLQRKTPMPKKITSERIKQRYKNKINSLIEFQGRESASNKVFEIVIEEGIKIDSVLTNFRDRYPSIKLSNLINLRTKTIINGKIQTRRNFIDTYGKDIYQWTVGERIPESVKLRILNQYGNRLIIIDEVHNINITSKNKNKQVYVRLKLLLDILVNNKVILMTATPMRNSSEEIVSILNLLNPKKQLSIEDFKSSTNKSQLLSPYIRGKISFVRRIKSNIRIINMTNIEKFRENNDFMNSSIVKKDFWYSEMEGFQQENYNKITKLVKIGFRIDERQTAIILVEKRVEDKISTPISSENELFGDIFSKVFSKIKFPKPIVVEEIKKIAKKIANINDMVVEYNPTKGSKERKILNQQKMKQNYKELIFTKLVNFSSKYQNIINIINTPEGRKECTYIYIPYADEARLLGYVLEIKLGYTFIAKPIYSKQRSYSIITSKNKNWGKLDVMNQNETKNLIEFWNSRKNKEGDYLHIIIGTPKSGEGFSFTNVRSIIKVAGEWTKPKEDQIEGRAKRLDSLKYFDDDKDKYLKIYKLVAYSKYITNNQTILSSIDSEMFKITKKKFKEIEDIIEILRKNAFDCYINREINGTDRCSFNIEDSVDLSTFNRYFSIKLYDKIKNEILNEINKNSFVHFQTLLKNLV